MDTGGCLGSLRMTDTQNNNHNPPARAPHTLRVNFYLTFLCVIPLVGGPSWQSWSS